MGLRPIRIIVEMVNISSEAEQTRSSDTVYAVF